MTSVADQMKVVQKADEGGETPPPAEEEVDYMGQNHIGDEFDNILCQEGLDWCYVKPTCKYQTIYIFSREEKDCCQWCEQTDIELCSDCGDCADPSKPHRCCECEEAKNE